MVEDASYGSSAFWFNRDQIDYVLAQEGYPDLFVLRAESAGSMRVTGTGPYPVLVIATPNCELVGRVVPGDLMHVVIAGGVAAVQPRTDASPDVPALEGTEWCGGRVPGLATPSLAP